MSYQGEGGTSGGGGSSESWEDPAQEQATANPAAEGEALERTERAEWAWRLLAVAVAVGVSWYLTRGDS